MASKTPVKLTPFHADLAGALSLRAEKILAATDLAEEVAALEPLEAYYIVKEVGMDQALPILSEMDHEQLQACIDLDCWNRYDFSVDGLDQWLAAFAQAGPEELASAFLSLDYVVQLLFLALTVTVYDPDTDQIPGENEDKVIPRAMTPDGTYLLELKTDLVLKVHPFTLLDAMYQYEPVETHRLLSEVRVELPMQIEEEALRFRNGRMEDLGFAPPEEAARLFSRPAARKEPAADLHLKPIDSAVTRIPTVYARPLSETTLLQQALSLVVDQESLLRLEQEIVWVINSAIIAYGEKTGEIREITTIAERVRDTISLGLESLLVKEEPDSGMDDTGAAARALELLNFWGVADMFRHGFAATRSLKQEVQQALREPLFEAWYALPENEQSDDPGDRQARAFVTALLGRHPMRSGFDLANPDTVRAFASLADINVARIRLKRLVVEIRGEG